MARGAGEGQLLSQGVLSQQNVFLIKNALLDSELSNVFCLLANYQTMFCSIMQCNTCFACKVIIKQCFA